MPPRIHDTAVSHPSAQLADDVIVGPYSVIGENVTVGAGSEIMNHVTLAPNVVMGERNVVWPCAVLGGHPQDLKFSGGQTRLEIGDDNVFREAVTVNIGTEGGGGVTRIGNNNLLMGNAHVAHDCQVGSACIISQGVMLAGHIHVEDNAAICGGSAMHQFVTVGTGCYIGGLTRIVHDVPPFMIVEGNPSEVRGVNAIGLARRGFSDETIDALRKAYRLLWSSGLTRSAAIGEIETTVTRTPEVDYLIAFLGRAAEGKHGRHLEKFR